MAAIRDGVTERVTSADGVVLSVVEWGNPAGPEIVLIHGAGQSYLCFVKQVESELAREFRLVAFDLRGHGGSDKPMDPSYYQNDRVWADDVSAVLEAKRLRRPVLVGWSLGARVVRQYLAYYGDAQLSGIALVAARPIEDKRTAGSKPYFLAPERTQDLMARIDAAVDFLHACFEKQPDAREFEVALAYNMLAPHEIRKAIMEWAVEPAAAVKVLGSVKVPTLIIHGAADHVILPGAAQMTADAMPGARLSIYPGCGHSPFFEDSARFNSDLSAFATAAWKQAGA